MAKVKSKKKAGGAKTSFLTFVRPNAAFPGHPDPAAGRAAGAGPLR